MTRVQIPVDAVVFMIRIRARAVNKVIEEVGALGGQEKIYMSIVPPLRLIRTFTKLGVKEVYCAPSIFRGISEVYIKHAESLGVKLAPLDYLKETGLKNPRFLASEERIWKQLEKYDGLYQKIIKELPSNWAGMDIRDKRAYITGKFKDNGVNEYTAYAYAVRKIV